MMEDQNRCFLDDLEPALAADGMRRRRAQDLSPRQADMVREVVPTRDPIGHDAHDRGP